MSYRPKNVSALVIKRLSEKKPIPDGFTKTLVPQIHFPAPNDKQRSPRRVSVSRPFEPGFRSHRARLRREPAYSFEPLAAMGGFGGHMTAAWPLGGIETDGHPPEGSGEGF